MAVVIDGSLGISPVTASGTSASVDGMTVGRGGGEVSTNTAVGASALNGNSTGANNVAVGYQASALQTTNSNVAVGAQALYNNTDGGQTAVGYQAGYSNTSGEVCAFGYGALYANQTGSGNTAMGNQAGYNTTGSNNTAIGGLALKANTTASNNTAVGYQAGYTNSTGNWNTYIGKQAGQNTTGSLNTFIAGGSGSLVTSGSSNSILGAYSGNAAGLDIRTASNYVVLSDGDGNPLQSSAYNKSTALQGAIPNTGIGITFPATQSASSDANTLDDYEEGTWTPTLAFGGGSTGISYGSRRVGTYTKVGRLVTINCFLTPSNIGSSTGSATITGLPFAQASNLELATGGVMLTNISNSGNTAATVDTGQSSVVFYSTNTGGTRSALSNSNFSNGCEVAFTISYNT